MSSISATVLLISLERESRAVFMHADGTCPSEIRIHTSRGTEALDNPRGNPCTSVSRRSTSFETGVLHQLLGSRSVRSPSVQYLEDELRAHVT